MRVRSLIGGHGVKPRCFLFNEGFSLLQTGSVPHTGPIVEARRRSGSNGVALRCAYLDTSEPRGGAWARPRYEGGVCGVGGVHVGRRLRRYHVRDVCGGHGSDGAVRALRGRAPTWTPCIALTVS